MGFKDLLIDILNTKPKTSSAETGANMKLLTSYLEQHPMAPFDVATLLILSAGTASREREPMKSMLLVGIVKLCYDRNPLRREIDEALEKILS